MSDLVKRLRQMDRGWPTILSTAADRIEQLEREMAEARDNYEKAEWCCKDMLERNNLHREQLAAEKALADRLAKSVDALWIWDEPSPSLTAYRKARGL